MKNKITVAVRLLTAWLVLVALLSTVRADYHDVYSLYLERGAYLQEVEMWTFEYSAEVDKWYGIDIQNACDEVGRSDLKHCFLNMLFQLGMEYRVYRWF
jgi:hypothetical protein